MELNQLFDQMRLSPEVKRRSEAMKPHILLQVNERIDRRRHLWRNIGVAATIAVLLGLTGYLSYVVGYRQVNSQLVVTTNPPGMLSTLTLSDGTRVYLNAGTVIRYPAAFVGNTREVQLTGEAYFEVTHDADHPFIVRTDELQVRVFGTRFNVKSYVDDEQTEVSLVEGSVGVQVGDSHQPVMLSPGKQIYYDKERHRLTVRSVNMEHYTAWRNGKYYFRALPLKEIARQLERIFNVHISVESEELGNIVLTGDFVRGESLDQILRIITADRRLTFNRMGDSISITSLSSAKKRAVNE
jgi:ferric-dicitrate binding protein FerR (iron transport regulator)